MKPITVKDLMHACVREVDKGNGNKIIMISDDDEGNGFHYLWYSFTTVEEFDKQIEEYGLPEEYKFNYNDDKISKKEDTMILG